MKYFTTGLFCSLRNATLSIALFSILGNCLVVMFLGFMTSMLDQRILRFNHDVEERKNFIVALSVMFVNILMNLPFVYGVVSQRSKFIIPWIVYSGLQTLIFVVLFCALMAFGQIGVAFIDLFVIFVNFIELYCVTSYYVAIQCPQKSVVTGSTIYLNL